MPYAILEYTDNIVEKVDFQALFSEFHQIIHDTIEAPKDACASYVRQIGAFYVREGQPKDALVRLELCLLAGRAPALRQALGEQLLACLKRYYTDSLASLALKISVRLVEMPREDYFAFESNIA